MATTADELFRSCHVMFDRLARFGGHQRPLLGPQTDSRAMCFLSMARINTVVDAATSTAAPCITRASIPLPDQATAGQCAKPT